MATTFRQQQFAVVAFSVLVGMRLFVTFAHEVLRDEVNLLLVANEAPTLSALLDWQRYEEGFVLWPTVLYLLDVAGVATLTVMRGLNLIFSIGTLTILLLGIRRVPLRYRLLLACSYFLLYEYTAFTRSYGLASLALATYTFLAIEKPTRHIPRGIAIGVLAASNGVGFVLALAFAGMEVARGYRTWRRLALPAVFLALGLIAGIAFGILKPVDAIADGPVERYRQGAFADPLQRGVNVLTHVLIDGFFFIPPADTQHWWYDRSLVRDWLPAESADVDSFNIESEGRLGLLSMAAAIGLVAVFVPVALRRDRGILVGGLLLWGLGLGAYALVNPGYPRHLGLFVLGNFALVGMAVAQPPKRKVPLRMQRLALGIITASLSTLAIGGVLAAYLENRDTISQASNVARFLQVNFPDTEMVVIPDYTGQVIAAKNDSKFWSLEGNGERSFVRFDTDRRRADLDKLRELADRGVRLVVTAPTHDDTRLKPLDLHAVPGYVPFPLAEFSPAVWWDEVYWVQRLVPVQDIASTHLAFVPWLTGSPERQRIAADGVLEVRTVGTQAATVHLELPALQRVVYGEVRASFQRIGTGHESAILQLGGAHREATIEFTPEGLIVRDSDRVRERIPLDVAVERTYRLEIDGEVFTLTIDDRPVIAFDLKEPPSTPHALRFGDPSVADGSNFEARVSNLSFGFGAPITVPAERLWNREWAMRTVASELSNGDWVRDGDFFATEVEGRLGLRAQGRAWAFTEPDFISNAQGSTFEVDARVASGALTIVAKDGVRAAGLLIGPDSVTLLDWDEPRERVDLRGGYAFHRYRVAFVDNHAVAFVDGREIGSIRLYNRPPGGPGVLVGSLEETQIAVAEIERLALGTRGAYGPTGAALKPPANAPRVQVEHLDEIPLSGLPTQASSENGPSERAISATDGNAATFWHVQWPSKTAHHTLTVDMGSPQIVRAAGVVPRGGAGYQIWSGERGVLQGSVDGVLWTNLARLPVDVGTFSPAAPGLLTFAVEESTPVRYVRLSVDGHRAPLSIAEFRLWRAPVDFSSLTKVSPRGGSLVASTENSAQEVASRAFDGDVTTFWHIKWPTKSIEHWIQFDFPTITPLAAIRVRPREVELYQVWNAASAELQAAQPDGSWTTISTLPIDEMKLVEKEEAVWLSFPLLRTVPASRYRIYVKDPGFLSIAEVEAYTR